jgi:hypothetical protein
MYQKRYVMKKTITIDIELFDKIIKVLEDNETYDSDGEGYNNDDVIELVAELKEIRNEA